jgi:hypothetical protein
VVCMLASCVFCREPSIWCDPMPNVTVRSTRCRPQGRPCSEQPSGARPPTTSRGGGGGGGGDSQVCISYEHSDPVFGLQAVSHSCACIGSPCLRHCVHGASIGARGGGACHRSAALTLHGGLLARRRAHGVPLHQPRRHHGVLWHVAGGTGFLAGACTCARTKHKASPSLTCQLRASSAHTRLKRHVSLDPGPA